MATKQKNKKTNCYDQVSAQMQQPKIWFITGVVGFSASNLLETLLKLSQAVFGLLPRAINDPITTNTYITVQTNILASTTKNCEAINQVYNVGVDECTSLNQLFDSIQLALQASGINHSKLPAYREFRVCSVRHPQADLSQVQELSIQSQNWPKD